MTKHPPSPLTMNLSPSALNSAPVTSLIPTSDIQESMVVGAPCLLSAFSTSARVTSKDANGAGGEPPPSYMVPARMEPSDEEGWQAQYTEPVGSHARDTRGRDAACPLLFAAGPEPRREPAGPAASAAADVSSHCFICPEVSTLTSLSDPGLNDAHATDDTWPGKVLRILFVRWQTYVREGPEGTTQAVPECACVTDVMGDEGEFRLKAWLVGGEGGDGLVGSILSLVIICFDTIHTTTSSSLVYIDKPFGMHVSCNLYA
mmetsp:Transcript_28701/g.57408  ORF Transcript_28701/g.57408 Transcript_28701/m.57408 type:complete len:260 (-) Transcript_28701:388-1167(-)